MKNRLWTGHEADIAATETGEPTGETITIRIRVGGTASHTLAHPYLPLGKQSDGSVILDVQAWRRLEQPRAEVVAGVLATVFLPRKANWVEAGLNEPPAWRVDQYDQRQALTPFGPGQLCDYWDGL